MNSINNGRKVQSINKLDKCSELGSVHKLKAAFIELVQTQINKIKPLLEANEFEECSPYAISALLAGKHEEAKEMESPGSMRQPPCPKVCNSVKRSQLESLPSPKDGDKAPTPSNTGGRVRASNPPLSNLSQPTPAPTLPPPQASSSPQAPQSPLAPPQQGWNGKKFLTYFIPSLLIFLVIYYLMGCEGGPNRSCGCWEQERKLVF